MPDNSLTHLLKKPEFPRSNGYDPAWGFDNQMGPNALVKALEADRGRYIGFMRATAVRSEKPGGMNLYDPAVGVRAGVDE